MCLNKPCYGKPYKRTDEQFFYKHVHRSDDGEMIAPQAGTILHECIGEWQRIGFWRSLRHLRQIQHRIEFSWKQFGKLFVHRSWQDPHYYEVWLVESASKRALCDSGAAALGTFRFLGQVVDADWDPKVREAAERRSAATKKGWETRRKNQKVK